VTRGESVMREANWMLSPFLTTGTVNDGLKVIDRRSTMGIRRNRV
jgi:hypothetical protein